MDQVMASRRRAEFAAFVFDLVDFIEERIREALNSEPSRVAAIGEAAAAALVLRDRLHENETVLGQFLILFGDQLDERRGSDWWRTFATMDRGEFEREAEGLLRPDGTLAFLRKVSAAATES
jgi:hypothetical protein